MAQVSQGLANAPAGSSPLPAAPPAAGRVHAASPEDILALDAAGRAFVEFESEDGRPLSLRIFDREDQRDLLNKSYPDGVIYEYIDFNQFGLPLERIAVVYQLADGTILRELAPAIRP
jgi:hypothetical protein